VTITEKTQVRFPESRIELVGLLAVAVHACGGGSAGDRGLRGLRGRTRRRATSRCRRPWPMTKC
jgi:hypothetical protein